MGQPPFNPSGEVRFNLAEGRITLGDRQGRVLVPTDALVSLCQHAPAEAVRDFGRGVGGEIGRRVADRLGTAVKSATVETIVEHLGGDLALAGLGSFAVERWGRALVFRSDEPPTGAGADPLIAAVLEGALQRGMARDVTVVSLGREGKTVRFLVASAATARRVAGWLAEGTRYGDALGRLNAS